MLIKNRQESFNSVDICNELKVPRYLKKIARPTPLGCNVTDHLTRQQTNQMSRSQMSQKSRPLIIMGAKSIGNIQRRISQLSIKQEEFDLVQRSDVNNAMDNNSNSISTSCDGCNTTINVLNSTSIYNRSICENIHGCCGYGLKQKQGKFSMQTDKFKQLNISQITILQNQELLNCDNQKQRLSNNGETVSCGSYKSGQNSTGEQNQSGIGQEHKSNMTADDRANISMDSDCTLFFTKPLYSLETTAKRRRSNKVRKLKNYLKSTKGIFGLNPHWETLAVL